MKRQRGRQIHRETEGDRAMKRQRKRGRQIHGETETETWRYEDTERQRQRHRYSQVSRLLLPVMLQMVNNHQRLLSTYLSLVITREKLLMSSYLWSGSGTNFK